MSFAGGRDTRIAFMAVGILMLNLAGVVLGADAVDPGPGILVGSISSLVSSLLLCVTLPRRPSSFAQMPRHDPGRLGLRVLHGSRSTAVNVPWILRRIFGPVVRP